MSSLNAGTLVLNRGWMAVQICSVRRAISLVYQGHAKVVDQDFQTYSFNDWSDVSQQMVEISDDEFIHSPTLKIKVPRVIVLILYDKLPKRIVSFSRKNIFERDKFSCQYCGVKPPNKKTALKWMEDKALTFDHVIPRSQGGKTTWNNIVTCCLECNKRKGSRTPAQMNWKLKKKPKRPEWQPTLNIPLKVIPHKEWVNFLDVAYYNIELENDNEKKDSSQS